MINIVRKFNNQIIDQPEWDQMVDEQVQNAFVVEEFIGSQLSGTDATSGRIASLANTVQTALFVSVSGQILKPSQYSASGTSLTINVIVDNTSPIVFGYLKQVT